ncbi:flagellar hook assembly protein FlgD [Ideonella sp. YS5]|uniref:flagellar hook assembly protein FlgD n=1 Tax=Ideonella sp. YS5 TaxID=3453714 RepID=UPI003EEB6B6C
MSSIGAIGASTTSSTQSSNISMQDFLNILLTQLTYQDPLKPMDNQEFMAQLAQFTTLGQTQELSGKIDSLVSTQASMQAIGLIGRTVQFTTSEGTQTGTVASLSWAGTTPELSVNVSGITIGGISLSQVTVVR